MLRALRAPRALLSCSLLLAFVVGCGVDTRRAPGPGPGPGPGGADSGADTDAGGITLSDSGPTTGFDSGPTTPPPPPSGPCGTLAAFGPLPAACMPRCTSTTLTRIADCSDADCRRSWLEADPTPSTTIVVGGETVTLDCDLCYGWQMETCVQDACPFETQAYRDCIDAGGTCEAEVEAFNDCIDASSTAQSCVNTRVGACFS